MTSRQKGMAGLALLIVLLLAYAYIATAFERYTLWASVILGLLVVILAVCLVRFPGFRSGLYGTVKGGLGLIGAFFESQSQKAQKGTAETGVRQKEQQRPPIPPYIERMVLERAGHACQKPNCGKEMYLQVHHIDKNRWNNNPGNLILLCVEHHKQADHNAYRKESLKEWRDRRGQRWSRSGQSP